MALQGTLPARNRLSLISSPVSQPPVILTSAPLSELWGVQQVREEVGAQFGNAGGQTRRICLVGQRRMWRNSL